MKWSGWDRNKWILLLLGLMGVLLLLLGGILGSREAETGSSGYAGYLERRAETICKSISGVEEAEVFLTLNGEAVSAGMFGESPSVSAAPAVRGVAVVCTGGDLPRIRAAVTELLSAALDVPTNRIRVAGK